MSEHIIREALKAMNRISELTKQRDALLVAIEEIRKVLLKLSDDADMERYCRQNSMDSDFYLSEGKFIGIEKCETQVGKIINDAKAAIAAANKE